MHLLGFGDSMFLELQHGSGLEERRQAAAKSDVGDRMMKSRVEAADDVVNEVLVVHRSTKAGETICHDFHARAILENGEITLVEIPELGAEINSASILVVAEEVADAAPEGVRGVGVLRDHGEELGRNAVVEPRDNGAVVLHPVVVAFGLGAVDMIAQPVLAEDGGERAQAT